MTRARDLTAEVQELAWAVIDETATADQVCRLETLLLRSAAAQRTYVRCMQMGADLHWLLGHKQENLPPLCLKVPQRSALRAAA